MAQFIYLKSNCEAPYPVGYYFAETINYINNTAQNIYDTFPKGKLILVGRGHSGSILAGGIAYLLSNMGRDCIISISRKSESTHGDNLTGIHKNLGVEGLYHIIVIDDFIESGQTVLTIIEDLANVVGYSVFDMLCVANHWDDEDFIKEGGKRGVNSYWKNNNKIASHFKYICCNKPPKIDLIK